MIGPPPVADASSSAVVAVNARREAHVTLRCVVTREGALKDCTVLKEAPAGQGFGAASMKVARTFKVAPAMRGGVPVEGAIVFPITWRLPPTGEAAADGDRSATQPAVAPISPPR